jgi:hypothetical protein
MSIERRRSPRVEILDRIHGHVTALDVDLNVRDMSLGGMSLQTPFAFPEGAIHEFKLTLGDGSPVILKGRVVRTREQEAPDGSKVFVLGVEFVEDEAADGENAAGGLMDRLR